MSAPTTAGPTVTLDVADGVARIGLNRPARRNTITLDLARSLRAAAIEVRDRTDVGAVVLYGHGRHFCVGGELADFAAAAEPGHFIAELADTMHTAILGLRELPVPVIAAVHGSCAGAGMGLALGSDLVVAERSASFMVGYSAVGLTPDCGVSWLLTRRLGHAVAADLILNNRPLDAVTAHGRGLVSELVDTGAAMSRAEQMARALAHGPRQAHARTLQLLRQADGISLPEQLRREAAAISAAVETPDAAEGLAAFLDKRPPVFG